MIVIIANMIHIYIYTYIHKDCGPWLKDQITNDFKAHKQPVTVKYVDPTYMVRAVLANAKDNE